MERKDLCDWFAFKASYQKVFLQKHTREHAAVYENCISGFYLKI